MGVTVRIPQPLRTLTAGSDEVQVGGSSISEVLAQLDSAYPGMAERILQQKGQEVNRFVMVFLNDRDIRLLEGTDTPVQDGDVVSILPLVAGG